MDRRHFGEIVLHVLYFLPSLNLTSVAATWCPAVSRHACPSPASHREGR